jgi:predicted PurR-regulated permease PerM
MKEIRKWYTVPGIVSICLVLMIVAFLLVAVTGRLSAEQATESQPIIQKQPNNLTGGATPSDMHIILKKQVKLASDLDRVEATVKKIGEVQSIMQDWLKRAESRSFTNKLQGRTAVRLLVAVVITLGFIAIGFPGLFIWYNSRRLKRMSAMSSDIASTLVLVQERQAKLGDTLRELQDELDYIPVSSAPDFAKLLKEAEQSLNDASRKLDTINNSMIPDK